MTYPKPVFENLEELAALALAASRIVATALREDVLHRLKPQERSGPERLLRLIEARQIFDQRALDEIAWLERCLTRLIIEGTFLVDRSEADECNVSPAFWQESRLTEEADAPSRALAVILDLQNHLEAVHDILHAEAAITALRQKI